MNKRFLSVVLFAVAASALVSFLIYRMVAARLSASAQAAAARVVVASRALAMGSLIREGDVKTVAWRGPVPPQAVTETEQAVGRGVVAAIYEGEPVVQTRLAP